MHHRWLVMLVALLVSSCGISFVLVEAKPRTVLNAFAVEPGMPWNWQSGTQDDRLEMWTQDGIYLNSIDFYAGIKNGEGIFFSHQREARSADKGEHPLVFRSAMTSLEIEELFRASMATTFGTAIAETRNLQPAVLGGMPGFRFETRFVSRSELEFEGTAVGAVRGEKLYLIWFYGVGQHYYRRYLPEFERIVASVRFI